MHGPLNVKFVKHISYLSNKASCIFMNAKCAIFVCRCVCVCYEDTNLSATLKTHCLSSTLLTAVTSVHDRNQHQIYQLITNLRHDRTASLLSLFSFRKAKCNCKHVSHVGQCFSTFMRPRSGKFFFHNTRARSQQIYT